MINNFRLKQKTISGFTFVELLIVISIIVIMVVVLIGAINPVAMTNKARDSKRKSDLNKIKIAFEEYYNSKGEYPDDVSWNVLSNCGKQVPQMKSYLTSLPCDPDKVPYYIEVINANTFKVLAELKNKKDKDIPTGWTNRLNYGVSSSNILWYQ
jgi:type II secretory pathway pseudopilin PulG